MGTPRMKTTKVSAGRCHEKHTKNTKDSMFALNGKQPVSNPSSTTRLPLRIGLLIDSFVQRKWIHKVIEEVQSSGIAEIAVVIKNEAPKPKQQSRLKSYWRNRNYLLYEFYGKLDDRRVKVHPDAFEPTDIQPLISDCPVVAVTPTMKAYSDWFPEETLKQIRDFDLDVALCFGFRILRGDVLKIARHGVWSFHHGDNAVNRGGPPGFWEVVEREPVTGSILQVLTSDLDAGRVLYRSWSSTHGYSVLRNRARYYGKTAAFAIRALRDLHRCGHPPLADADASCEYRPYTHPLYKPPTNREMVPILLRLAMRAGRAAMHN